MTPRFAHVFGALMWNLMCRADNVEHIKLSQLAWDNDALTVYFAHMKNDQEGDQASYLRHLYANPVDAALSPVLALALYLSSSPGFDARGPLFPGKSQKDRFSKCLDRMKKHPEIAALLKARGIDPADIVLCHGRGSVPAKRVGLAPRLVGGDKAKDLLQVLTDPIENPPERRSRSSRDRGPLGTTTPPSLLKHVPCFSVGSR
jgi:hypothetical protein